MPETEPPQPKSKPAKPQLTMMTRMARANPKPLDEATRKRLSEMKRGNRNGARRHKRREP
jgi:hypothetical protein